MDVIQLVQSGIDNVVASGGTALTINQIRLIHRFTENITLLYDGDKAGIKAAIRGIDMMLEEGLNVRVILLPEGEDPDSFAKKHNASDLQAFLENNTQDFIRFKTKLLSEDAQNDPTKRSEMILQIVNSIAVIPDIIKRQVYIKDTASLLTIPEDVLLRKINEIRKEQTKKSNTVQSESAPTTTTTTPQNLTKKELNIFNLLQIIVRHGEKIIYADEQYTICAGEYIIQEIRNDHIDIVNPLHQLLINEFSRNYRLEGFVAATFFQQHPNVALSQMAVDMIADKYQLSRIYSKRSISENVMQEVQQDEAEILPELVQRLLLELKYTVVEERIDNMQALLKDAEARNDEQLIKTILQQYPQLKEIHKQLSLALGNRVIVR